MGTKHKQDWLLWFQWLHLFSFLPPPGLALIFARLDQGSHLGLGPSVQTILSDLRLPSLYSPLAYSVPATGASLLLLLHTNKHGPASGPLHELCPPPRPILSLDI